MKCSKSLWLSAMLPLCACSGMAPSGLQPTAAIAPATQSVPMRSALAAQPNAALLQNALADWSVDRQHSPDDRALEIQRLSALPQPNALTQLRLAHLLFLQTDSQSRTKARSMIAALAQGSSADAQALAPLTVLIRDAWVDRGALEDRVDQLSQQLRDAQARSDALNAKIQELKSIERSLVSRPAPEPAAPAPAPKP
jgi:hypothetical protein